MFSSSFKIDLPRRVTASFLLFALAAIIWLGIGVFEATNRSAREKSESAGLTALGRISHSLALEYLKNGESRFQSQIEDFAKKYRVAYLSVVGADGKYIACSDASKVGLQSNEPAGASEAWGSVRRVRYVNEDSIVIQEYRTPLQVQGKGIGVLRLAIAEPKPWTAFLAAAKDAPLVLGGPLAFIALGVVALGKMTRPVAAIESQLQNVATASTMIGCTTFPIEESGPVATGWNRLVQERQNSEPLSVLRESLEQSLGSLQANKLEALLNNLNEGIATTDRQGMTDISNRALVTLLQWKPFVRKRASDEKETSEKRPKFHLMQFLQKRWQLPSDSPLNSPINALRTVVVELECPFSESRRVVRVSRSPIDPQQANSEQGHLWTFRDITQQKLAEEMRDQFVDTATHELRTPLANIKAYAETLATADISDVEQQKEFLNVINSEATRLARFVDDLLSVSSMEAGALAINRQPTDLERLFKEVIQKVQAQMDEKHISLDVLLPEKFPELKMDKDKISATLVNLLGNASKYTPEGGHVVFRISVSDTLLSISVEDTGIGIAEDEIPKLFNKFFRSDDPRVQEVTGTGLGLSLAQEVIRLHDGQITVTSELEKGTKVLVTLPLE